MYGEVLTALRVPDKSLDVVGVGNEDRADGAVDADSTVSDRDGDRLLFEKFPNRVFQLVFHISNRISLSSWCSSLMTASSRYDSATSPL